MVKEEEKTRHIFEVLYVQRLCVTLLWPSRHNFSDACLASVVLQTNNNILPE